MFFGGENMASMKDIAAACHVSIATVSKALHDHQDISEETKLHIRKTAKEMGYLPSSAARALKTRRTYNIGVLFVEEAHSGLTHSYFSNVLDSFKVTAEERGYDITFLNCNKQRKDRMSYLEHSRYRAFDGVVIACVNFEDPEVIELVESDIPVVTIDRDFPGRTSVSSDNYQGMYDLVSYIHGMGHTRIAYIHGFDSAVTRNRLQAFYDSLKEYGITVPADYIMEADYRDTRHTAEATERLLSLPQPPTCIIFPDDYAAFGGLNVIRAAGLRIPEDISVAGYDGLSLAVKLEPALTTVSQDTRTLGTLAAQKLIRQIEQPAKAKAESIMVKGRLLEGATIYKCR
jgi:LacI family transcriptional regulator/LacI family purine nucleotide synthesis repressor